MLNAPFLMFLVDGEECPFSVDSVNFIGDLYIPLDVDIFFITFFTIISSAGFAP